MNWQLLVIDDSPKIHTLVRAVLAKDPVDVHTAADPRHGLVLAASLRPDLILLDIDMPEIDGFETARRLRADAGSAECPIIFLTAHGDAAEKVKGFGLGAVDYVTKPFNAAELCMRVRASLKTRRTIRGLEQSALIDPLTGLGNRAMFDRRLDAEVHLQSRAPQSLAVLALELNHLATIEVDYGASTSRGILKHVGGVLEKACRPEYVPCRLDGPLFAVLLPQSGVSEASALANDIRQRINRLKFQPPASSIALAMPPLGITAKTGIAVSLEPYDRSMCDRAHAALAEAAVTRAA